MWRMAWGLILVAGVAWGQERAYSVLAVEEMLGRVTILASDDPGRRLTVRVGFKPY